MELVEDCRDKKGKLDMEKVYLKLIDAFTISLYTAKTLYDMKVQEAADPDAAARERLAEQEKKLQGILDSYKAKGQELNEEFAVVRDVYKRQL